MGNNENPTMKMVVAVVASSSAPEAEFITKNLTRKKFKFGSGLHIPAKNFKEIIKIKSDHHNNLNNFCEIEFNSEECPSHHTNTFTITFLSYTE